MLKIGLVKSVSQLVRGVVRSVYSKVKLGTSPRDCQQYQSAGVDSQPLPDDYAACANVNDLGTTAVFGYLDPKSASEVAPGEFMSYGRDADGNRVSRVHQKNDGTVVVTNAAGGSMTMDANGALNINGLIIDSKGNITSPGSISTQGKIISNDLISSSVDVQGGPLGISLILHKHTGVESGNKSTTPPIP